MNAAWQWYLPVHAISDINSHRFKAFRKHLLHLSLRQIPQCPFVFNLSLTLDLYTELAEYRNNPYTVRNKYKNITIKK